MLVVIQWVGHRRDGLTKVFSDGLTMWRLERMDNNRTAKRIYLGGCAGSRSVVRPRKKGTDTMKDCFGYPVTKENDRIGVNSGGLEG